MVHGSHAPSHGTREVLIIYGALLSSDPGDIHDSISNLIAERIRVSVVGLSAQVAICAELCSRTNAGDESQYNVAMDETHYKELFLAATTPPVNRTKEQSTSSLLMMGFHRGHLLPEGPPATVLVTASLVERDTSVLDAASKSADYPQSVPLAD